MGKKVKRYRTAGGVVLDDEGRVLLLRREVPRERTPSLEIRLPKGHIEPGETPEEAAMREVCEESGYCHLDIVADLGELHNEFDFRNKHIVRDERYFLMRLTRPDRQPPHNPHPHSEEALFQPLWASSLDEAEALLTFDAEKEFIRRARQARAAQERKMHNRHILPTVAQSLTVRGMTFEWGRRTYIMGILNITPDSFSGDGLLQEKDRVAAALSRARQMLAEGADILDVGGESTRPGSKPVPAEEELRRVIPVVQALRAETDAVISIDTSKAVVAEAALAAGADIVNDVWGLRLDRDMARVVAERGAPVILMHNRSNPKQAAIDPKLGGRYVGVEYENLIEDVKRELGICLEIAHRAGISDARIILDPGLGFGKTVEQNLELIDRLDEIKGMGYPLLLGASRKSFIGYTLDLPPDQRAEGAAAITAIGIDRGADIVRVHDVLINARVARMTDAIVRR